MLETEFLSAAQDAARLAGEVLESWAGRFTVSEKSPANLVTEADLAAQDAIYQFLHARFPEHNFLGEEGLMRAESDSPFRWVVDPLDGTSNYVHRFPYYGVSIALEVREEAGREGAKESGREGAGHSGTNLLVGVVYDPNRDEMFSAVRGGGATLNGRTIRTSGADGLMQAMVVASLPIKAGPDHPAVKRFVRMLPLVQTLQRTGSAALNLAYVAAGRIDAYWSLSLKPWDMAAGALLVTEAGGRVSKVDGSPLEIEIPDLVSSNGSPIHNELQNLLDEENSAKEF